MLCKEKAGDCGTVVDKLFRVVRFLSRFNSAS